MVLTEEQLQRIEQNRQRALILKKQKTEQYSSILDSPNQNSSNIKHNDDIENNILCQYYDNCQNNIIDASFFEIFNEKICINCKRNTNEFDLITKSEAMKQYLITEDSLSLLNFKEQQNPHQASWLPMKLYLRKHVLELSMKRFGSIIELDKEKKCREEKKYERDLEKTRDALIVSTKDLWNSITDNNLLKEDLKDNSLNLILNNNVSVNNKRKRLSTISMKNVNEKTKMKKKAIADLITILQS